jgi:hypothetical protein
MPNPSDTILRKVLGSNLQTGAARAVLLLAAFSVLGALFAIILR